MKRTPMKRRSAPRRPKADRAAFDEEALRQRVCAVCGRSDSYDPHHVIERQYLRSHGLPEWNPDDVLRVCDQYSRNRCHSKHTDGSQRIPLTCLSDRNIRHAFYLLGSAAYYYLTNRYEGSDPRIEAAFAESR